MSDAFTPFANTRSKSAPGASNFRLTIVPQAQEAAPFQPVAAAVPNSPPTASKEPQVSVEREGDRITRIRVQCCCGQVVELNCAY